ncbi:FAD-dependent oxidoreductase [Candidatus Kaiserbacteria bacterium]|nr:FAD-dependent oxidoreductase [Candidatus Kaiserbacteria bacterium]
MAEGEYYEYVVLGAGVSGLGFAKRVSERGKSVLVLEKEAVVGGLSRSIHYKGFYLDFCAHRFHTKNKALLDEILTLPGLEMHRHIKKSRNFMFGKYIKYPFEVQDLLRAMPLSLSIPAGFSFLWNMIAKRFKDKNKLRSFEDWFSYIYGYKLYEVMARNYTAKVWRHDPREISADWADQRLQGEDLVRLLQRIIKKIVTLDFRSYDLADDSLAPDGGPFYYPLRGIQEMPDALSRAAMGRGARILTSARVLRVDTENRIVFYEHEGRQVSAHYGELISTIPLHMYYRLQDRRDPAIEKHLAGLQYMDIIFVYLFLDVPRVSNDHWLYFPDQDIIFNRAVEFSNWSPEMCPKGKTSICFDITSFPQSPEWKMKDEALAERTIIDAARVGYIKKEHVIDSLVVRVTHAYPFYDLDYKEKLDSIVRFLETDHEHLLGRTGIFRYNNSDNSIEMGFELAEKLLAGNAASAHTYTVKQVSY